MKSKTITILFLFQEYTEIAKENVPLDFSFNGINILKNSKADYLLRLLSLIGKLKELRMPLSLILLLIALFLSRIHRNLWLKKINQSVSENILLTDIFLKSLLIPESIGYPTFRKPCFYTC